MTCASCGHDNPDGARFCNACGQSLASSPVELAGARKVVSIVFADLAGSTSLQERLDAESARLVMDRYYRTLRSAIEAHGGRTVKLLGDGVMAAFGVPRVAEDDAIRAVRAAVTMQQAFRDLLRTEPILSGNVGLRVAVNTGEVVVSADNADVVGDPANVAARLQQEAQDGEVLIGEATRRLVGELVTLEPVAVFALKGRLETVAAYRVVSLDRPVAAAATAFVGRDEELRRVLAVYEGVVTERHTRLAVLLGSPGLGKSRLLEEIGRRLDDGARVLTARCETAGGATFAPIAKAICAILHGGEGGSGVPRAAIELAMANGDASERARITDGIAGLLGGTPGAPEETFFVIRRFLAALAGTRPVVLVIDDLQWAEPLLLDLIEHLVQWGSGMPLLVLASGRPELRDIRSTLVVLGGVATEVVTLAGLDSLAATRLAASVIGADALPAAVAGRVLATSEGNPLFVGELVRMLVADGTLRKEGDRWITTVDLATLDMPPTIHALLAARIERLRAEDRVVLERAAIVGREFSRSAVAHLLSIDGGDLDARLESLRRSELVESDAGWFLGEPALRFHHGLTRDAAYRRVLKGTRAELHARSADWIESKVGEAVEYGETIGWHLEQAHQHLLELGPLDEHGKRLGERAAGHLGAAGQRALARDDLPLAAGLLGRAIDRLDHDDAARADFALDWCEALLATGDVGTAAKAIDELARFLPGLSDPTANNPNGSDLPSRLAAWHACFTAQLTALTSPQSLRAAADSAAGAAEVLAAAGDAAGEAKAHAVHAGVLARLGEFGACESVLDKALVAARRGRGDRRRSNAVLAGAPVAALWGPSPVTRASGRCLDVVRVLRITQGAPAVEAVALRCQAVLETLRGRGEAARRMIESSRRMVEELGLGQQLLEADLFAGLIALLEGDAAAAEPLLRRAYEGLRVRGLGIDAARAAALLGKALLPLGRAGEAEALSHESEALAGDDLKSAIAWRGVRAEALAQRGETAVAIELARAAVAIAARTDALLDHADARLALATALRAAGQGAEADAEERRATELREAKGATLLTDRAPVESAGAQRAPVAVGTTPARIRPNLATDLVRRLDAANAALDANAGGALLREDYRIVLHDLGISLDRSQVLDRAAAAFREGVDWRGGSRMLATLGDTIALSQTRSFASGTELPGHSFGPHENQSFFLIEAGSDGRAVRAEVFGEDRLGSALAHLYALYAGTLPDGPARTRAATTARAVAVAVSAAPIDADAMEPHVAAELEFVDHRRLGFASARGAARYLDGLRRLRNVSTDTIVSTDAVLAAREDTLLLARTSRGVDARTDDGPFEVSFLLLWAFDADGRVRRHELFDREHAAEALARFDALASRPARRVRPNAATATAARLDAALAARDLDALAALLADEAQMTHHPTGSRVDRTESLRGFRRLLKAEGLRYEHEALAALGDSLALFCVHIRFSGIALTDDASAGATEIDDLVLFEVDTSQRRSQTEAFATDRLGDALVRLYECYAELQPEGAARESAEEVARVVRALLIAATPPGQPSLLADDATLIDHRRLGFGSGGTDLMRELNEALHDLAEGLELRVVEILRSDPRHYLLRSILSGVDRQSGGRFERETLQLRCFDASGRLRHSEYFDADHEGQALARLDDLMQTRPQRPASRVRPNWATEHARRIDAVVAASGDAQGHRDLCAPELHVVHHPTGSSYGVDGAIERWRGAEYRSLVVRHEPRATLGDALGLFRVGTSAAGAVLESFDSGTLEVDHIALIEADATARATHIEVFASDHFAEAIARFYELHAGRLPAGGERERAVARARSISAGYTSYGNDSALAPCVEFVDHRPLGFGSARGAEAIRRAGRIQRELTADLAARVHDVLALRAEGFLLSWTTFGTNREGGAFENHYLMLRLYGDDGLLRRMEWFDVADAEQALARFDALTTVSAPPTCVRRVHQNEATAIAERVAGAIAAGDEALLESTLAEDCEILHHPTGAAYGRDGLLASWRGLLRGSPRFERVVLAGLGEALALARDLAATNPRHDARGPGAAEWATVLLIETDGAGRTRRGEVFGDDELGRALVRLYERHAELLREGPERMRAAIAARAVAAFLSQDIAAIAGTVAADVRLADHRILGLGSARSAKAYLRGLHSLRDLTRDRFARTEDVLAASPDALLVHQVTGGVDRSSGGGFEKSFLQLFRFGREGHVTHVELFDLDRTDSAFERLDALTREQGSPPRRVRRNAAAQCLERIRSAALDRDVDAVKAHFAEDHYVLHHATGARVEHEGSLARWQMLLTAEDLRIDVEPLAALGDRLVLCRDSTSFSAISEDGLSFGPAQSIYLDLVESNEQGRIARVEALSDSKLGDALVRLYARYAELLAEAPAGARAATIARTAAVLLGELDLAAWREALASDIEFADRRRLGSGPGRGADSFLAGLATLLEMSPDSATRVDDVLAADDDAILLRWTNVGTDRTYGAAYERPVLLLWRFGVDGRLARWEMFEAEAIGSALVRFDEVSAETSETPFANAAWRALKR